jgi:hypothetical protein
MDRCRIHLAIALSAGRGGLLRGAGASSSSEEPGIAYDLTDAALRRGRLRRVGAREDDATGGSWSWSGSALYMGVSASTLLFR